MTQAPATRRIKPELLTLLRNVPVGSVVTVDCLAVCLKVIPTVVATLLANLTIEERAVAPWHRVIAKGGAIGRGPHRDEQFARLVREGVPVAPAGIVQDMARVAVTDIDPDAAARTKRFNTALPAAPPSRSRGMKDHPA